MLFYGVGWQMLALDSNLKLLTPRKSYLPKGVLSSATLNHNHQPTNQPPFAHAHSKTTCELFIFLWFVFCTVLLGKGGRTNFYPNEITIAISCALWLTLFL
jgi:hypothetical protein